MRDTSRRKSDCRSALRRSLRPEVFRALADETRLTLVGRLALADRPLNVSELSTCCGIHLSGVSRQLALLRQARVIRARKRGREVLYTLEAARLSAALRGLAAALEDCPAACCGGDQHDA